MLLAHQGGAELSLNELATQLQAARPTVERYLELLEQTFVIFRLPSFSTNPRKEITKSRKVSFWDTGIRNALLNAGVRNQMVASPRFRPGFPRRVWRAGRIHPAKQPVCHGYLRGVMDTFRVADGRWLRSAMHVACSQILRYRETCCGSTGDQVMRTSSRRVGAFLAVWFLFCGWLQHSTAQQKAPVPDASAQQAAKKMAGEIYGGRFALASTADERTALAAEMIAAGLKIEPGSADQFVLLDIAREIAAGTGDAATALSAVKELGQRFDVPAVTMAADTLLIVARQADTSTQRRALAEASVDVIDKLAEADQFQRAIRLGEAAHQAAQQSREFRLGSELSGRLPELRRAHQQFQQYRDALAVMEDDPTDPTANLAAGRYLCLVKDDWELGVPMLALGSDEPLKAAAVLELQGTESAEEQAAIGDAWWDAAETKEGDEREILRSRAAGWYRQAATQLAGSLAGLRIKQRLEKLAEVPQETSPRPAASKPSTRQRRVVWTMPVNNPKELVKNWTGRNKIELDAGGPKFVVPGEGSRPNQASLESRFGLTGDFEIVMAMEFSRSRWTNTGTTAVAISGERFEIRAAREPQAFSPSIMIRRQGDQLMFRSDSSEPTIRQIAPEELEKPARLSWYWIGRSAYLRGIRVVADGMVRDIQADLGP